MRDALPRLMLLFLIFLSTSLAIVHAKDSAIVIFDASGSMWGQVDGKNKITIAREVMGTLVKDWNEDIELGLMAYGHREKGNCADIEMLQAVAPVDSDKILGIINKITPKGKTPISESLKQAAENLRYTEDPATVILISDGEESCNADPCVVSKELEEKGINFTTHVIGFDIKKNKEALKQLKCIAENTGGQFFAADDAKSLKEAIVKVKKEVVDPRPTLCKTYAENAVKQEQTNLEQECSFDGKHWTTDNATHFDWCVKEAIGSELPDQKSKKRMAQLKKCEVDKKNTKKAKGKLKFNWAGNDYWYIFQGDKNVGSTNKEEDMYLGKEEQALQAGTYTIKAKPNSLGFTVFDPFDVTIKNGETVTIDKGGILKFNWVGNDYWYIFQGDKNVGSTNKEEDMYLGKEEQALQAGTYTIKAKDSVFKSFEITIKKGETLTIDSPPAATKKSSGNGMGMLEFNWPGKDFWVVFRGDTEVKMHRSKRGKLALQAGVYTIKPRRDPVFDPFEVTIKQGETKTIDKGGMLEFNWQGKGFWVVFRGDTKVKMHRSKRGKLALQAGTYTIKPRRDPVFEPFDVTIKKGETLIVDK